MEKYYFHRDFIFGLSLYFQQIQLSLLIIPRDEFDEFKQFFEERILPEEIICSIKKIKGVNNQNEISIPKFYEVWVNTIDNLSGDDIRRAFKGLPKLSIWNRLLVFLLKKKSNDSSLFFFKEEVDRLLFLLKKLQVFLDAPRNDKDISSMQNLRMLYIHAKKNILYPRLTIKQRKKAESRIEHFAINPVHPKLNLLDFVSEDWYCS